MPRKAEEALPTKIYAALCGGLAAQDPATGIWWLANHGTCTEPLILKAHGGKVDAARRLVRCRQCEECMKARRNYWVAAAIEQERLTREAGGRTWFGTLTLSPASHKVIEDRARMASEEPNAEHWDDLACDVRYQAVRRELYVEVRRYFARLRKRGHKFKYFLVFERHPGKKKGGTGENKGRAHMHWLLHEANGPIRKRTLQELWPWGVTDVVLLGGKSKRTRTPKQAAFYVAKYLQKSDQARQLASQLYRPGERRRSRKPSKRLANVIKGTSHSEDSPSRA